MEWIDAILELISTESLHRLIGKEDGPIAWWQMTLMGILVFLYGLVLVRSNMDPACR
jgi:hypothetical protein